MPAANQITDCHRVICIIIIIIIIYHTFFKIKNFQHFTSFCCNVVCLLLLSCINNNVDSFLLFAHQLRFFLVLKNIRQLFFGCWTPIKCSGLCACEGERQREREREREMEIILSQPTMSGSGSKSSRSNSCIVTATKRCISATANHLRYQRQTDVTTTSQSSEREERKWTRFLFDLPGHW